MRVIRFVVPTLLIAWGMSCKRDWPPEPLRSAPADFIPGVPKGVITITGTIPVYVVVHAEARKEYVKDFVADAYCMSDARLELPYNLFAIDEPASRYYVETQFEVVYFDNSRTLIRVDPNANDRVAISLPDLPEKPDPLRCPGACVRYRGKVYELHADGWYSEDKLLHPFSHTAQTR